MHLRVDSVDVAVTTKRIHNLNLRIRRDGSVALSVPTGTSLTRVRAFLDERAGWIAEHRARILRRRTVTATPEGSPDTPLTSYPLWGELLQAPDGITREGLERLYRDEVARVLPDEAVSLEPLVGAYASGWQIRSMRSRWGSCTPTTGRIRINSQLAAYPRACLTYVVAHELTHLLEPSHNARFHALLGRVIPNEREIRALLRRGPLG